MKKLTEFGNLLINIEDLADTFCAIDIANRNGIVELPSGALTVPCDSLRLNVEKARGIYESMLKENTKDCSSVQMNNLFVY